MSTPPDAADAAEPRPAASGVVYRCALGTLLVLGGVAGLFSGLQATRLWRFDGLHVSVGALVAVVANVVFGVFAAWGLRSRDAALLPGVGWFVAVLGLLFLPRPGGDIVLPETGWDAAAFLVLGFAGMAVAAVVAARIVPRAARRARPPASPRALPRR